MKFEYEVYGRTSEDIRERAEEVACEVLGDEPYTVRIGSVTPSIRSADGSVVSWAADVEVLSEVYESSTYTVEQTDLFHKVLQERNEALDELSKVREALRTPDSHATRMHALSVRQERDLLRGMLDAQ